MHFFFYDISCSYSAKMPGDGTSPDMDFSIAARRIQGGNEAAFKHVMQILKEQEPGVAEKAPSTEVLQIASIVVHNSIRTLYNELVMPSM